MFNEKDYNKEWRKRNPNYSKEYRFKNRVYLLRYQKNYNQTHKKQIKLAQRRIHKKYSAILHELKANGCAICGYDKCDGALNFHHIVPKKKKFYIAAETMGHNDLIDEINKCILLCSNCHREIHHMGRYQK